VDCYLHLTSTELNRVVAFAIDKETEMHPSNDDVRFGKTLTDRVEMVRFQARLDWLCTEVPFLSTTHIHAGSSGGPYTALSLHRTVSNPMQWQDVLASLSADKASEVRRACQLAAAQYGPSSEAAKLASSLLK
jgi:hypothetical protein